MSGHTINSVVVRFDADRSAAPIGFSLGSVTIEPGASLEAGMAEADRRLDEVHAARLR